MGDRDWEKELAEIDKRLAATPDEALASETAPARVPAKAGASASRPAAPAAPVVVQKRHWTATAGLLLRLVLAGLLLAAVIVWPYETRCGAWLAAYLGTITLAALVGLWTSIASWRHRAAFVHVLSLGAVTTAVLLAAMEVLPRVGYAMPDPAHPAMWVCR